MMSFEEDFANFSGLEDFDIDALEDFMKAPESGETLPLPAMPSAPISLHDLPIQMSRSSAPKRRAPNAHLVNIPGNKRSFRDYTKPIKRGFMNRQIPSNDIRRVLGQIIVRACNDSNHETLLEVLSSSCGPAVVMTARFIGAADSLPFKNACLHRELHGVHHIANYLTALFEVVPDGLVKLLDTKVHMFQNGCSYIVGKFTFKGHKCYDLVTLGDSKEKRTALSKFDRRNAAEKQRSLMLSAAAHATSAATAAAAHQAAAHTAAHAHAAAAAAAAAEAEAAAEGGDFHFDAAASDSMSDLEAFLFDDLDGDEEEDMFQQHNGAARFADDQDKAQRATTSVALEAQNVEFIVSHPTLAVDEIPLSFLGTIAFYLDPDAKIFKVEVLSAVENTAAPQNSHKKPRRH